jgi:hypothetical protein
MNLALADITLWRKYVASVGWPLNIVCIASLTVVLLHDFVFADSPELFQNAEKAWNLLYQLALALLASYVFFYVNVHLPKQQDRENVHQFLNSKTFSLIQDALHQIRSLHNTSSHDCKGRDLQGVGAI